MEMTTVRIYFIVSMVCYVYAEEYYTDVYNTTIAVIVEPKFMSNENEDLAAIVKNLVLEARKNYLKAGDLTVEFHTRSDIIVRRNLAAVLSIASCTSTWSLFRNAEDESILHLAITEADCPRLPFEEAITVPLVRGGGEISQIILDLRTIHSINWKSAVLFYEDAIVDRYELQRIIASLSLDSEIHGVDPGAVSVFRLDGEVTEFGRRNEIYRILQNFPVKKLGTNFLAVVSRDLVPTVMEVAKTVGLVHPISQWLYIIPDTMRRGVNETVFSAQLNEGDNVSFIYNSTYFNESCRVGLVCHIEELLKSFTISLDRLVREEIDLSNQVSDEEWETIRPTTKDRRASLLSHIKTELAESGKCDKCVDWTMRAGDTWGKDYFGGAKPAIPDELLEVGSWHPREGHTMKDILFPHVEHGFRGRSLPIVSFNYPPWQIIKYNESGQVVAFTGLIFEIVNELAQSLNFSYTIIYPEEGKKYATNDTIQQLTNVTLEQAAKAINWDRMIEIVQSKQVFLGAGAFIITADRKRSINFTIPVGVEPYTFLVARPRELSRALLFLSPFTGDTWLCIAIAIAVMGPLLNWFHRVTPYYEYFNTRTKGGLETVTNCLWYVYGALLQQGGIHLPMADSGRLIIGTWWLFVLVIVTTYSGNLVAFLTFPKIDNPITTLEELLQHKGSMTWGLVSGSAVEVHLKGNTEAKYRNLYENAEIHPRQDMSLIDRVRRGEHVYIDWKTDLLFLMKKEFMGTGRCDFTLGAEEFLEEQVAMIVAQGSPYLPRINEEIRRIHRVGLIYKWLDDYLPKKDKCWSSTRLNEVTSHTVNMRDMQGSFFVLFLGFVMSVFVILGECIWRKYKIKHEKGVIKPFAS